MEHISKVFLDSRYTLPDGTFVIPGESILLSPTTRCWVSEFTCVASWDTLDHTNRFFNVYENGLDRLVAVEAGPHDLESLRAAMETALNAPDKTEAVGDYTVERVSTGMGGSTFRAFRISLSSGVFRIPAVNNTMKSIVPFTSAAELDSAVHLSGFVDVRRVHSIYLHTDFGNHNAVSPTGSRSVFAKIPVNVGYGGLLQHMSSGLEHDFVECGSSALSTLRVELRDAEGLLLDRKGTAFSLTLVFERRVR
jgi:hypothetical protein